MGFVAAPDGGPTPSSVFQGLVVMVVFAAPAVGTLLAPERVLAMGGAMFVVGAALFPGGSPLGLLMLMPGVLLVLAGITSRPALESPVWMRLIATAIALVAAVYLALDAGVVTGLLAMALAAGVAVVGSRDRANLIP